jgi:drug/metabolite transporter (DMT)-like permease
MIKNLIAGILFAMLWASASAATKIGLLSAQPFVIGNFRFFIAGCSYFWD